MNTRDLGLREAGGLISRAGLTDDVIRASNDEITQRRGRQRDEADDAPTPRKRREDAQEQPRNKTRREPEPVVEDDDDQGEEHEEIDDDAEGSTREDDGELEDDENDGEDAAEEGDESEGDDSRADPLDAEYTVKVNGEEFRVKAKELVAGYQRNKDYIQKTQAVANKSRELVSGHGKVAESYARKLQQLGTVTGHIRGLLIGDMNSAEMQALRTSNPAEWTMQRQLMQDRIGQVDQVLQTLNTEHERHVGEFTATQKAALNTTLGHELDLLVTAIPDWKQGGGKRVLAYLGKTGFTAQEIDGVYDSRMLIVADKARKWDEYQAARNKPAKRTPKPIKKTVRAGQTQIKSGGSANTSRNRDYEKARTHAKKTGDMRDAGRAIGRMLNLR